MPNKTQMNEAKFKSGSLQLRYSEKANSFWNVPIYYRKKIEDLKKNGDLLRISEL